MINKRLTVIAYLGGKFMQAPWITGLFPPEYARLGYLEPFCGSLAVFLYKERSRIATVLNDKDSEIANLWTVIQTQGYRLAGEANRLLYSEKLYNVWSDEWYSGVRPEEPFERALRFFYIARSSFAAKYAGKAGWAFAITKNQATCYRTALETIVEVKKQLEGAQISCRDFREVIAGCDAPNTLIYCDPPYVGTEGYYSVPFTENDHKDLAELLKKSKSKVAVSYYDHEMVRALYPERDGWHYTSRQTIIAAAGTVGKRRNIDLQKNTATELVITNYQTQLRLAL